MKSWASGMASRLDGTFLNLALFFAAVMSTASRSNRCAKKATSTPLEILVARLKGQQLLQNHEHHYYEMRYHD